MSMAWTKTKAEAAVQAIPPAWGLEATVAVNPFVGQTDKGLAETAEMVERVTGERIFPPRKTWADAWDEDRISDDDLVDALLAGGAPMDLADLKKWLKRNAEDKAALAMISDLATNACGTDWSALVTERMGAFLAAEFDAGQALWAQPVRDTTWETWRAWARRDVTPEIHGLSGFAAMVAALPSDADKALAALTERLGLTEDAAEMYFLRLLTDLGGWAQLARQRLFEAEKAGGYEGTARDLLAIRLAFEVSVYEQFADRIGDAWAALQADYARPLLPRGDHVIDAILQDAAERAHAKRLAETLAADNAPARSGKAKVQAAFCIDVRSEVFRRALESVDTGVETLGFAGFFGLGVAHRGYASDVVENRLPVLLSPGLTTTSAGEDDDLDSRYASRAKRAWGRFKLAAVSSFAFVEASGPLYAGKLLKDSLKGAHAKSYGPAPRLDPALPLEARIGAAKAVLGAMSLTRDFAPLVVLVGHGANVTNAAHESALHCGACGGYAGDVNARLLAGLLNDITVRKGLRAEGINVPDSTLFVGALHDTTTDQVTLFDADVATDGHADALAAFKATLEQAGRIARGERALRLPRATSGDAVPGRSADWSETRPEWALAGCAAFIAAPRGRTMGRDLGGRAFLHNYNWQDDDGFGVLELIMTAPVVVASWISLQYYGSTVAPKAFGGGSKVLHNVVGGVGVVEGNGGRLRTGLPLQSVHDGDRYVHDPLRLAVAIEAPREAMSAILDKHPSVAALFDNGWLTLFALDDDGQMAWRYKPGGDWDQLPTQTRDVEAARMAAE
ncbi:DUF2309 family protein [Alphaproteobacteria bacterium GH1-50]|uniref:Probable inorganic carbon transporter subunit DabA n=1 Tax=Kangsaoukella pontilimi TaxID=2691042 RepID=A0A7C9IU84_9RHOB|nr:DUF2309 domain-containing protein [Kangsaoukella pontilimi]MXQ09525.1 DUF2309 family protein [Kangsaoukella pontilimi]